MTALARCRPASPRGQPEQYRRAAVAAAGARRRPAACPSPGRWWSCSPCSRSGGLLGISAFTWIIVAIPMLASLIWRRWARVPVASSSGSPSLAGSCCPACSCTAAQIVTFTYRLSLYRCRRALRLRLQPAALDLARHQGAADPHGLLDDRCRRRLRWACSWALTLHPAVRELLPARPAQPAVRPGTGPAGLRRGAELPGLPDPAARGAVRLQQLLGRQHRGAHPGGHRRGRARPGAAARSSSACSSPRWCRWSSR